MTAKRVVFDLTIAGITFLTIYEVTKYVETKKQYSEISTPDHPNKEVKKETVNKVKELTNKAKAQIKKAVKKVVDFVKEHKEDIDAITSGVSLIAACFTLKGAVSRSVTPKPEKPAKPDVEAQRNLFNNAYKIGQLDIVNMMLNDRSGKVTNCPNGETLYWHTESPVDSKHAVESASEEVKEFVSSLMKNDYGTLMVDDDPNKVLHYQIENIGKEVALA